MGLFDSIIDRWQQLPKQKKDVIRAEWPLFAVVLFIGLAVGAASAGYWYGERIAIHDARIASQDATISRYEHGTVRLQQYDPAHPPNVKTSLRLQFFGDVRIPTAQHSENTFSWYALWSPSAAITFADAEGKRIGEKLIVPKNWSIFVIFEKPTQLKEIAVSFSAPGLPPYEVKQQSSRFVIVNVSGDLR